MRMTLVCVAAVFALSVSACGSDDDDRESAEQPEPTPTTETAESEEPEVDSVAADPEEEWLDRVWEEHVEDLVTWWNEHYESECDLTETECVEHFTSAHEDMRAFADEVRNSPDQRPRPLPLNSAGEAAMVAMSMEAYHYACLDRGECSPGADDLEARAYDIISETDTWWTD